MTARIHRRYTTGQPVFVNPEGVCNYDDLTAAELYDLHEGLVCGFIVGPAPVTGYWEVGFLDLRPTNGVLPARIDPDAEMDYCGADTVRGDYLAPFPRYFHSAGRTP